MSQAITISATPGNFMQTLHYSQGDVGRDFTINIDPDFTVPSGATVEIVATKPSGFGFTVAGTVTDNSIAFTTTEAMTDEWGTFAAELKITHNSDVIGTANFWMKGEQNPHPDDTVDGQQGTIVPQLTLLVERVETAASNILDMTVNATTLAAGSDATYSYDSDTNTATFGIPRGADGSLASGVLASTYSSSATYAVGDYVYYSGDLYRCTTAITTAEAWTSGHWTEVALADEVSDVKSDLDVVVTEVISDSVTTTLYTRTDLTAGLVKPSGTVQASTGTGYTQPFEVNEGEVLSVKKYWTNSQGDLDGETTGLMGTVVWFADNTYTYTSWGNNWNAALSSVTVPSGAHYAQITINSIMTGQYTKAIVSRTVANGQKNTYAKQEVFKNPLRYSDSLSANEFVRVGGRLSVDDYIMTASFKIPDGFSSFVIGASNADGTDFINPQIEVTPTQIITTSNISTSINRTINHGLTITDDLQIIVIQPKDNLYCTVILQSGGERWTSTANYIRLGYFKYGIGIRSTSAISKISASLSVRDLYKPVWVCGDSWVTFYDSRWYGQAVALDIDKYLHSGFAGENSRSGLANLETLLSMYKPKMIVWLYGMNDADTNDSTPNSGWLTVYNSIKDICNSLDITLVLATIPTTPTRNHNAKNAIITASGYRYVDEVFAVGADTSGNWISGYQSDDGDHTTINGARAVMAQVLADVPELALNN